jgi:putative effector of murein hydrolase LrgA (UPF0299 family)
MNYSFLSLEALPFLLPLLVCAIIFTAALYGHLNFKHIQIKTVSIVGSALMIPMVFFLVPLVINLAFDFEIPLLMIQTVFAVMCFALILMIASFRPKSPPSIVQISGLCVFLYGAYSFLA